MNNQVTFHKSAKDETHSYFMSHLKPMFYHQNEPKASRLTNATQHIRLSGVCTSISSRRLLEHLMALRVHRDEMKSFYFFVGFPFRKLIFIARRKQTLPGS